MNKDTKHALTDAMNEYMSNLSSSDSKIVSDTFSDIISIYRKIIWHPCSVKPKNADIVVCTKGDTIWTAFSFDVKKGETFKWAYIEDLMPDNFNKNKTIK